MAATTVTTRPLTPLEIARTTAAVIPWGISTRPILGIPGGLVGAGLVTLTGRMAPLRAPYFYRAVQRLRRRSARTTARTSVCGRSIHGDLRLLAAYTQLQPARYCADCCRAHIRHVLPAHPDFCTSY